MNLGELVSASVETAFNRYLSLDAHALQRFATLEGRIIAIEVLGLQQTLFLFPSSDGFLVLHEFDGEADATISGSPIALAKLSLAKDSRDVLFSGEVSIKGDTRLANQFNRLLTQIDIDWEEILSKSLGDIAAHKVSNIARDMGQWLRRSTQSVCLDSGEYIQEEIKLSPSNAELRQFIKQVDEVREAADRMAARVQILKNKK